MDLWLDVDFGSSKTGLANVGLRLYKQDGTDSVARTEVGVQEVGGGCYGALVTVPDNTAGVEWDSGEGTPLYAHEDLAEARESWKVHKSVFNRRKWDKVGNVVTIYDDDDTTPLYTFDTNDDLSEITPA